MHKFVQLWMFLLNIRWQIIVKSKQIFLHLLIVRGPGLSCCLKFCLLSRHFIHINGSPLCPSLPGTVLSMMSGPPLLLPSPSEGWSWLIQPSQSLWGGELTKSPLFRLYLQVTLCLGLFSVFQLCVPVWFSLFFFPSDQPWLKVEKDCSCGAMKKGEAVLLNIPSTSPKCSWSWNSMILGGLFLFNFRSTHWGPALT